MWDVTLCSSVAASLVCQRCKQASGKCGSSGGGLNWHTGWLVPSAIWVGTHTFDDNAYKTHTRWTKVHLTCGVLPVEVHS
jgi:hypothetical protein